MEYKFDFVIYDWNTNFFNTRIRIQVPLIYELQCKIIVSPVEVEDMIYICNICVIRYKYVNDDINFTNDANGSLEII